MLRFSICGALLGALLFVGCSKHNDRNVLLFGNGAEPSELDPQITTGSPEHRLAFTFFEGLINEDPQLNIIPGVAEKWAISADGLVYTFHLRHDAKWSNGDPVTADDFIQSYQRMLSPELGAEYVRNLYHVAGAEEYHKGKLKDFSRTGFKALDPYTLQLTLKQRTPFLLHKLNHESWFPVHIPTVKKFGGLTARNTPWTRPENFVGNGPYVLKAWRQQQVIVAQRSPTYWDRDHVKIEEIDFLPVEMADTEERMYRTNQMDITYEFPISKIPVYRRENPTALRIDPYNGVYFYRFNTAKKPFDDVRVRRALAMAVDRETLVSRVTMGGEQPAYHLVPPNVNGYNSRNSFHEDVAEAKRLLAEAGYPDGHGFPEVQLIYNTLEKHQMIGEAIQQMWRKNLGINVQLQNLEWKVYIDAQHHQDFVLQRAGWIGDYVDPHAFLEVWETGDGNNDTNWGNPEFDRLLHTALDAKTEAERFEIYQKMEKIFLDDMPVMPLFFYTYVRLVRPSVKGFVTTPLDNFPWKYAELEK